MKELLPVANPAAATGVETNRRLKACLLAAANEEAETAAKKIQNTSYWGEVGFVEASAVNSARSMIEAAALDVTPEEYRTEIVRQFNERIEIYRQSDILDPDGYGLGTLYAILRKCELYLD